MTEPKCNHSTAMNPAYCAICSAKEPYRNTGAPADRVIEECAELTKAICKAHRFGWDGYHPERPELNNAKEVMAEIADVRATLDALELEIKQMPELLK